MNLDQLSFSFDALVQETHRFLSVDEDRARHFLRLAKNLYDYYKLKMKYAKSEFNVKEALESLQVSGFDEEQIWQQLQLQNEPIAAKAVKSISKIAAKKSELTFEWRGDEERDGEERGGESSNKKPEEKRNKFEEDRFFKIEELEKFLDLEDQKEAGLYKEASDEEEVDYFVDMSSDEEDDAGRQAMYQDFFDPCEGIAGVLSPNGDKFYDAEDDGNVVEESEDDYFDADDNSMNSNNEEIDTRDVELDGINYEGDSKIMEICNDDESDDEMRETEEKSQFELQQEYLRKQIEKIENSRLKEKSWQVAGEVSSDKRPENSLLEEHLQFDHLSRPAPLITEETTQKVEDIIKQRIKDSIWDDVQRKTKPTERPFEYKRRLEMEQQKSKQSLAEVYEKEYLKQTQEQSVEENPLHQEIKKKLRSLCLQLDALSNFNFTPKPPQPEIKIINNLPAVSAEEPTPALVSEASLLAPQEVFQKSRKEVKADGEKEKTDKKRERRLKKKIQRQKRKYTESKEAKKPSKKVKIQNDVADEVNSKIMKSSKEFFSRLQDTVEKTKKVKSTKNKLLQNSKKLKL